MNIDYISQYNSPIGGITLASNGIELIGLWFDGQKHFGEILEKNTKVQQLPIFLETANWLDAYFAGDTLPNHPKLCLRGTQFRQTVWQLLLTIPYAETRTYGLTNC